METLSKVLCLMSESLRGKREGLRDDATRKKESLLLLESALLPHPTQWCWVREP